MSSLGCHGGSESFQGKKTFVSALFAYKYNPRYCENVELTFRRWFALVRIWSPWLAPRQGKVHFGLDKEAVMCSFLSNEGKHLVLLAISGIDDVMTMFTSDNDGNVVMHVCLLTHSLAISSNHADFADSQ